MCLGAQRHMSGYYLVSGSLDTNVKAWDLRSKKSLMTLKSHQKPITAVDISIDGRVVASGSLDSYVKTWENSSGRNIFQLKHGQSPVSALALNPRDMTLASGHTDRYIRYWDIDNGSLVSYSLPMLMVNDHRLPLPVHQTLLQLRSCGSWMRDAFFWQG